MNMKLRSVTLDSPQLAIVVLSLALFVTVTSDSFAQTLPKTTQPDSKAATPGAPKLSLEQELSLSLLRTVADELKSEADKPAVALLQAEAAETLWQFDEVGARALFRLAFDTARVEPAESSPIDREARTKQTDLARRRAFTLREIIVMVGKHDRQTAERWLASLNEDKSSKETAPNQNSQQDAEFLAYFAFQLVKTNPDEALRLGFLSLNAREVPSAFGQLLFALKRVDPKKSDDLFRAAIAAMRRGVSPGGWTLSLLSNYFFLNDGSLYNRSDAPTAGLFVDYLLESASAQARLTQDARAAKTAMPESAVQLTNFLALRGLAIVSRNAPQKLVLLQSIFKELSSALSQQQIDDLAVMTTGQRQYEAMESRGEGGLDADIQRAERERDVAVRDQLWRRLAVGMRDDPDRARSFADRIDDKPLREQTQDDVNLTVAGDALRGGGYEEARKAALRFNDTNLRAKTLAEVADVWIRSKNRERASEVLSEASEMAAKGEPSADRAAITLLLAQKFAKFDAERSFSLLEATIKIINHVQIADIPPPPLLRRGPRSGVITITMVGGAELTTGVHATLDSLNFSRMAELVRTDYFRSRNLGDNLQHKILRGRYLITLAQSFLNPNLAVKDSFLSPFPQ
jgi:hypothetical protein